MEEVVSHEIFAQVVRQLELAPGEPLRVLDLGSGTGDGVALLSESHGGLDPVIVGHELHYLGLDSDAGMVTTARSLHTTPKIEFAVGDMRAPLPDDVFDLYLSCGVPYSHLTATEMAGVLTSILRKTVRDGRPTALIVDVLGQFSIEWTPNWSSNRWNYAMSFFEDVTENVEEVMTFYDRISLGEVIENAAREAGIPVGVTFTDRSVLVGRHTMTRSFNTAIPPYRTLINGLAQGSTSVTPEDLRFVAPTENAPRDVLDFFQVWEKEWNALVDQSGDLRSAEQAKELASTLLTYERQASRGLGTGHSLTATVVVKP